MWHSIARVQVLSSLVGRPAFASLACLSMALLSPAAHGQAGGLAFPENGGPIAGTAQAGQAAVARDASTAWLNPAGLTRLDGTQLLMGIMPFNLGLEFDPGGGTTVPGASGGDAGDWMLGGSAYLSHRLNEQAVLGLSITTPYGLGIDPDDDWVGRYYMTEVELLTVNIQPALGVRLNEQWSIGGGLDIQYASFEQDLAVPRPLQPDAIAELDGDNWEVSFTLGVLWEITERTRLGLRYRWEVDHDLSGDLTLINDRDVSTGLNMPQNLTLSGYHEFNDQWALLADVGWTEWSTMDRTVINTDVLDQSVSAEIPRNWDDTWNFGVGVHYRVKEDWLLMAGLSFVESPVEDKNRTPDLPVDEQWRLSIGAEHDLNEKWTLGLSYVYADLGDNKIDQTRNTGRMVGDYETAEAHIIGLYGRYSF